MKHLILWEDGGLVSFRCEGDRNPLSDGDILSRDDEEPTECYACGAPLRLHWDVRIEALVPQKALG